MKKIIITPAGRKRYLEILYPYLKKFKDEFDEWHLWMNSPVKEDNDYLDELAKKENWIKQVYWDKEKYPNLRNDRQMIRDTTYHFFPIDGQDKDAIYLRLDDDIVWLEKGAITNMFDFRLKNPQYFLIVGNVINSSLISHLHQRFGLIGYDRGFNNYECFCNIGWGSGRYAELAHDGFLTNLEKGNLERYKFDRWELWAHERISINVICWLGSDFAKFKGEVGKVEEMELTEVLPARYGQMNCINGKALFSHFSFYTQEDYLLETDILKRYNLLK